MRRHQLAQPRLQTLLTRTHALMHFKSDLKYWSKHRSVIEFHTESCKKYQQNPKQTMRRQQKVCDIFNIIRCVHSHARNLYKVTNRP